jgi:hypothetical protein
MNLHRAAEPVCSARCDRGSRMVIVPGIRLQVKGNAVDKGRGSYSVPIGRPVCPRSLRACLSRRWQHAVSMTARPSFQERCTYFLNSRNITSASSSRLTPLSRFTGTRYSVSRSGPYGHDFRRARRSSSAPLYRLIERAVTTVRANAEPPRNRENNLRVDCAERRNNRY